LIECQTRIGDFYKESDLVGSRVSVEVIPDLPTDEHHIRFGLTGRQFKRSLRVFVPSRGQDAIQCIPDEFDGRPMGWIEGHFFDEIAIDEFDPITRFQNLVCDHRMVFIHAESPDRTNRNRVRGRRGNGRRHDRG